MAEESPTPSFQVRAQYVKDLSFESPYAPESLATPNLRPSIDVSVDIKARKLQDDMYECTLLIATRAVAEQNTLFLAELSYAGVFQLSNIPAEHIERVMLIECPFVLFPFARRVIADVTRDGGFPPLMLDPIDFNQLYQQNLAKKASETA